MDRSQYFFKVSNGPDQGPMGLAEFQKRLMAGEIKDDTLVWRSGMGNWITCAALHAADQRKASETSAASPAAASPKKAQTSPATAPGKSSFLACSACGAEWSESLLFTHGSQRICGLCVNR